MAEPGSQERPWRIAVIGSGPAGFYSVQALLRNEEHVEIDMFDRLPAPFGLVRYGVAPDHPKIKNVTAIYDKLASHPCFRFYGNVEYGTDLRRDDVETFYHQVVFATGAPSDRRLGIPGEDLRGSHPATEFVAWFNGHPDFVDHVFDFDSERAVVIGAGNVAVDVARILCRTPEELAATDIADHALETLRSSRIREVFLLGRRGPAQAKFTTPEVRELGELAETQTTTVGTEMELDPLSRKMLETEGDKATVRKVAMLQQWAGQAPSDKPRRLRLRFLVSPTELLADEHGRVAGVRIVRNVLSREGSGYLQATATDETEELDCGLVFRSVGYRGIALPGLPYDERRGVLPNETGRLIDPDSGAVLPGLYTSGWIKRGPSGIIGTNKPDAVETVNSMLEDRQSGRLASTDPLDRTKLEATLRDRGVRFVTYAEWQTIDRLEVERGKAAGRPRVKIARKEQIFTALGDEG